MERDSCFYQREEKNKERLKREYPSLQYQQFILLDDDYRIFIDDISLPNDDSILIHQKIEQLASACSGGTYIYSINDLTNQLKKQLNTMLENMQKNSVLLIFPGEGSQSVKKLLFNDMALYKTIDIPARRKIDTSSGKVEGVDILIQDNFHDYLSENDIKTILLIDDVIATGTTAVNIRERCDKNIVFIAAPLLMFSPIQNKQYEYNRQPPSGIKGFTKIATPLVYQGLGKIPPVNSISTLMGQSDRSKIIRDRFCNRNVSQLNLFNNSMSELNVLLQS